MDKITRRFRTHAAAMRDAFAAFNMGNHDLSNALLDEAFADVIEIRAWWLTETNPEYSITSPEFINFVRDYILIMYK